jgi:hypothetical protein
MSDFDVLGTVGKLALPTFARFRIRGNPSLGSRDMVPRPGAVGVFLVRLRTVFRSRFRLDPVKSWRSESSTSCMNVSSFQRAQACGSTCCESGRLCAQAWRRRWESSGIFSTALFRRPVFTCVVDVAPDIGFRRSWYRRKACATYFSTVQDLHRGELGFARYDPVNGGRWNVPYAKGHLLIEIPARPEELLTIRKLHVVAEVTLLLKGLGSRTKLQRVRENLRANVASQIGCFVNNT